VGYLIYLSEMLKIKAKLRSVKVTATLAILTIHESSEGSPSSFGARTGGDVVLNVVVFKTYLNVQAP
jgi:hypothetical protein